MLYEPVEKRWLITKKRNVRNLWAAHLQPRFITPTNWPDSLKAVSMSAGVSVLRKAIKYN
jgi:hypothetical protein